MTHNVIGTALQLQNTEACTLFYTFICSFYSAIPLLFFFFFFSMQANQITGLPTKQETQCLSRDMSQFSPPFRFLKKEYQVSPQTTHLLLLKNITMYTLLSKDTLLIESEICRKMLQADSNHQSLPALDKAQTTLLKFVRRNSVKAHPPKDSVNLASEP